MLGALAESQTGPERWAGGRRLTRGPQASQPPRGPSVHCAANPRQARDRPSARARLDQPPGVGSARDASPLWPLSKHHFQRHSRPSLHCLNACTFNMERAWSSTPQPQPRNEPSARKSNFTLFAHGLQQQHKEHPCRRLPEPSRPGHPKSMRHPRPHVDAARGSEVRRPDPGMSMSMCCTPHTRHHTSTPKPITAKCDSERCQI